MPFPESGISGPAPGCEFPQYAGYEIVNFLEEIPFQIIFVTATTNICPDLRTQCGGLPGETHPAKPVKAAIEQVQQRFREQAQLVDYQAVLSQLEAKHSYDHPRPGAVHGQDGGHCCGPGPRFLQRDHPEIGEKW